MFWEKDQNYGNFCENNPSKTQFDDNVDKTIEIIVSQSVFIKTIFICL